MSSISRVSVCQRISQRSRYSLPLVVLRQLENMFLELRERFRAVWEGRERLILAQRNGSRQLRNIFVASLRSEAITKRLVSAKVMCCSCFEYVCYNTTTLTPFSIVSASQWHAYGWREGGNASVVVCYLLDFFSVGASTVLLHAIGSMRRCICTVSYSRSWH